MSTLSLDPAVSLFEHPTRQAAVATTAVRIRSARPAARHEPLVRRGRHSARPQATHARRVPARTSVRSSVRSASGLGVLARTAQLVAGRALGTSAAAAAVTWALIARSSGDASDARMSSLRGLAAAAVICAAWGFQDRARLGALGVTRTWYATGFLLAIAHTAWFTTTLQGRLQDNLGLVTAVFTLDILLVVVPALLGARAGRPEGAAA
jgi:hypothetical protein